ncbi:DNA metabolism protein [Dokdonia sinensis]|uniref:DNA metabolism protein n=1 Tax=Dokdonia sinensis TaxID=2479847 RepID=A0A3M0G1A9_9FLAO|nr:TIGR03915 family putative DNA repair protein [Dokdonia sinensis]RMB58545.1 DNA metabolism protein [Dokdonia sinensis]
MVERFIYDGTFEGYLTAIFEIYERRPAIAKIEREQFASENLFDETFKVWTDMTKADRVWKGILTKIGKPASRLIYRAFLSEKLEMERLLQAIIRKGFNGRNVVDDFSDLDVLKLNQIVKEVGREKHRMDAFVRFRKTRDNIYFATVEPDFNVLPLNASHFKNRYADQKWLIYDLNRNYGIYYDLHKLETVDLEISRDINSSLKAPMYFTEEEMLYQDLWKNYFKSTNITSRKNMRLHLRHVPKRYWKYLSEKSPL